MARGSCLCGEVRFVAELPPKWVAHCHCSLCRRAHGAPYVTWVGLPETAVRVDGGTLRWYPSSADGERGFCAHCGAMMFFRSPRWPGELHVARPHFKESADLVPGSHAYWSSRAPWASIDPGDGLPRRD